MVRNTIVTADIFRHTEFTIYFQAYLDLSVDISFRLKDININIDKKLW